jgi:hypothetical protein
MRTPDHADHDCGAMRTGWRNAVGGIGAHDAAGRRVERPRQHQRDREAGEDNEHDQPHRPVRQVEEREHLRRDLDQQPADDGVGGSDTEYLAAPQFAQERTRQDAVPDNRPASSPCSAGVASRGSITDQPATA